MTAMIEIYEPRRQPDGQWAAAANVNVFGGTVRIVATAPEAVAARAIAAAQAFVARQWDQPLHSRVAGVAQVGGFWDVLEDIGKAVVKSPIAKAAVKAAASYVPVIGPLVAQSGLIDKALSAADSALSKAKRDKTIRKRIVKTAQSAKRGNGRAKRQLRVLRAAALGRRSAGGVVKMRSLARASLLLRRASAGDKRVRARLSQVAARAHQGHAPSLRAAGYLAVAGRQLLPYYDPFEQGARYVDDPAMDRRPGGRSDRRPGGRNASWMADVANAYSRWSYGGDYGGDGNYGYGRGDGYGYGASGPAPTPEAAYSYGDPYGNTVGAAGQGSAHPDDPDVLFGDWAEGDVSGEDWADEPPWADADISDFVGAGGRPLSDEQLMMLLRALRQLHRGWRRAAPPRRPQRPQPRPYPRPHPQRQQRLPFPAPAGPPRRGAQPPGGAPPQHYPPPRRYPPRRSY